MEDCRSARRPSSSDFGTTESSSTTLSHAELRAACVGLTHVLLRPGLNTVVDLDHLLLWSWAGELFAGSKSTYFADEEREIRELFGLACRAATAGAVRPDGAGWEESRHRLMAMDAGTRELMIRAHDVLVYLALPLLEAILRKTCRHYVEYDGRVVATFHPRGRLRPYTAGDRCSSLRDLLWVLYDQVGDADLREALDGVRWHLDELEPSEDLFDLVFRWRNSSLHGEASLTTIGGTVFNVAILVALGALKDGYEELRDAILERVRWQVQTSQLSEGHRPAWSYYPPY